jgi:hypothetical protein
MTATIADNPAAQRAALIGFMIDSSHNSSVLLGRQFP